MLNSGRHPLQIISRDCWSPILAPRELWWTIKDLILAKSIVDSVTISSAGSVSARREGWDPVEKTVNFSLITCSYWRKIIRTDRWRGKDGVCTRAPLLPDSPVLVHSWRSVHQESTDEGTSVRRRVSSISMQTQNSLLSLTLTETDAASLSVTLHSRGVIRAPRQLMSNAANKRSNRKVKHQEEINVFNVQWESKGNW